MNHPTVHWEEWPACPSDDDIFGHGIHFHDKQQRGGKSLVAFIEGFEWLRNRSAVVRGYHVKPNSVTTTRVLAAMKRRIEQMVADQVVASGPISHRISGCANA